MRAMRAAGGWREPASDERALAIIRASHRSFEITSVTHRSSAAGPAATGGVGAANAGRQSSAPAKGSLYGSLGS
eukprot:6197588-Pleurochrysis_carterae.AAC.7